MSTLKMKNIDLQKCVQKWQGKCVKISREKGLEENG